jgi:very-short-patch-repair endonuclease
MRTTFRPVEDLLRAEGVIARRDHPELARTLSHLASTGRLVAVLPGVYASPSSTDFDTRVRAVLTWNRDCVLVGTAAARSWFWPTLACRTIEVAVCREVRLRSPGFRFVERLIPDDLMVDWGGIRMTVPALTALDLCGEMGGDAIDVALRTRSATLGDLERALELTPHRVGNAVRRQLLHDSRDQPWSPPERRFHRLLRAAGLTGWSGNVAVHGPGWRYCLDVAFEAELLDAEVDGREHHSSPAAFEADHRRQNRLVQAGWTVLRFTPSMIDGDPEGVIATVNATLCRLRPEQRALP